MERNRDFVYLDRFVWDTAKNELNRKKHGFSFETAARIFNDPYLIRQFDNQNSTWLANHQEVTDYEQNAAAYV